MNINNNNNNNNDDETTTTEPNTTASTTTAKLGSNNKPSVSTTTSEQYQEYYIPLPDLHGKSDILEQMHIRELSKFLPPRAECHAWTLAFTTSQMGFSLKSLYRSLAKYEGPVLLVIKDSENVVFGVMCSCNLQQSECFYGTGETYLFTFKSSIFRRYHWAGDNQYFIKGNSDSLVVGAGEGNFGLWLDEDLYHGTTNSCRTFNNEPLTNHEDFVVCALECWCFI